MTALIHPTLWAEARLAYLGGETVAAVCARFGMSRSAFYERAGGEGWRRRDLAPPQAVVEPPPSGPPRPAVDLAEEAMGRADRAIAQGDLHAAEGWTRLATRLRALAAEEEGHDTWREALSAAIDREARTRNRAEPDGADEGPAQFIAVTGCSSKLIGPGADSPARPVVSPAAARPRPELAKARRQLDAYLKARARGAGP